LDWQFSKAHPNLPGFIGLAGNILVRDLIKIIGENYYEKDEQWNLV